MNEIQEKLPRPFFSIIVPCYNSGPTIITLLESIVKQHMDYNDIQVVLSDDCSTQSYQDEVNIYKKKLRIVQTKTDYNYCPGNTRQRGVQAASGQWITFMDHDDELIENSYQQVKKDIQQLKCDTVFFTRFYKKTIDGHIIEMPDNAGWTHGRFYNLDNFWNKYGLHYIKDLTSHEDISITTQIEFVRKVYDLTCYTDPKLFTYVWKQSEESLSNRKYTAERKERPFIDVFFVDYMESTAGVSYDLYKRLNKGRDHVIKNIKDVLLYAYFYLEFAVFVTPQYLKKNFDEVYKYIKILKDQFNQSIDDIYRYFRQEDKEDYQTIALMALQQTACFVFDKGFKQWLQDVWDKKY